ncbi:MAG: HEAT repeat domain-containing protein, partial [Planctomycetota bacterium]
LDDEVLVQRINHVDRRLRLRSQWELAERGAADALIAVAENTSSDVIPRLHGVWGAQHAARIEPSLRLAVLSAGRRLLADNEPTIRAAACQLAAEQNDAKAIQRLTELVSDNHPRVVMHAMLALARLGSNQAARSGLDPVLAVLAKSKNQDPAIRHAAIQYLTRAIPGEFLADLSANNNVHVRRAAVAALRLLADGHVAAFLNDANPIVASEAAIAIHDRPIPVAIEDLASQLSTVDPATSTEAFLRRAISANFKIGTGAAADRLTDFAASSASSEWARIEALDCLLDWTDPDPRDRVTNEFRPTPSRQNGLVEKSLDNRIEELMLASASVREKSIDVASQLGLARIAPQLQSRVSDSKLRPDNRAGSLIALARLDSDLAVDLAKDVSAESPVTLAVAALDILGQHAGEESLARFVDATKSDVAIVRGRGWDLLATSESATATDRIREGVADYLAGSLSADVHLNVIEAARLRLTTAEIDELNAALEHASLQDPMVRWMPSLHGGNVQRGADLFFGKTELSCVRCHKVDRVGGEVGPNLTLIGKQRDRQSLLESICLPDAKIAEGYETAVIANEDGQVFTGIVGMEDDDIIELIAADGARVQIDQEEIIARKKGKSSMPAGLAKLMTPRELRDLVAYLASLQVSRRNADETE